jgi:DMSO/TMAO reductase YedYZ molybdopterin-dependent catalytic subunit
MISRRRWLQGAGAFLIGGSLAGCDQLNASPEVTRVLQGAEGLTMRAQRLITDRAALAREFSARDISSDFRANGSLRPGDAAWQAQAARGFSDWRLIVDGLVERPAALSLRELHSLPARTQITRHDCVEGWSSIGQWTGARLAPLLDRVGLRPEARFLVFHCADELAPGARYYESIDLVDALHPQTILAYAMNGRALPTAHGAPLRLRVERQLGYKHAKYVMRIEAVADYARIGGGQGGFWEDRGYAWYAGI